MKNLNVQLSEKNAGWCLQWPRKIISAKQTLNENKIFVLFDIFFSIGSSVDGEQSTAYFPGAF